MDWLLVGLAAVSVAGRSDWLLVDQTGLAAGRSDWLLVDRTDQTGCCLCWSIRLQVSGCWSVGLAAVFAGQTGCWSDGLGACLSIGLDGLAAGRTSCWSIRQIRLAAGRPDRLLSLLVARTASLWLLVGQIGCL